MRVARKYPGKEVPVEAEPGDVVFFAGHILHRSHTNRGDTPAAFVRRPLLQCPLPGALEPRRSVMKANPANYLHILARGTTHLAYAQPAFGTPCAANDPRYRRSLTSGPVSMMADDDGMMAPTPHARRKRTKLNLETIPQE